MPKYKMTAEAFAAALSLPGFDAPVSAAQIQEMRRQTELENYKHHLASVVGGGCWGCGRKPAGFSHDGTNARTLRRRCIACRRKDRAEAEERQSAQAAKQARETYATRLGKALRAYASLAARDRAMLDEHLERLNVRGVKIERGSPIWNQLLLRFIEQWDLATV